MQPKFLLAGNMGNIVRQFQADILANDAAAQVQR